jgi:hypothetical protein
MRVERIFGNGEMEKFKISAGNKSIVIQGNRPLLKNKTSGKKRIKWKLYQGSFTNPAALALVILELEKYLENIEEGNNNPVSGQK